MKAPSVKSIKPAPYNPRKITEHGAKGLKTSMEKFGDISGITWNKRTGNLISGHQRWNELTAKFNDLSLEHTHEDRFSINSKEIGHTGFDIRIVDWDEATERAANISANNHAVGGEWETELLHTLMDEIKTSDGDLFKDLNFDILESDLKLDFNDQWDSDMDEDSLGGGSGHLNGLPAMIKITCNADDKDEVLIYLKAKLMETSFEGVHIK